MRAKSCVIKHNLASGRSTNTSLFHFGVKSSQDVLPGYIEQRAAGPSCPVRGGVGCKRCSSSVSCVGRVYVCAMIGEGRFEVFFRFD